MKKLTILFVAALLAGNSALAQEPVNSEAYYQVSKVTITEEIPTAEEIASGYLIPLKPSEGFMEELATLDWNTMVLIGEKIIEILKANAPVFNLKRDPVAVVPQGVTAWQQMAGWQAPVTKVYTLKVSNYLGMTPVEMRLKVSAMWGGNVEGRGQYLANVQVVPTQTYVMPAWTLDVWQENSQPVNNGTLESPRAGLGFEIRYKISNILNEMTGTQDYFITGDGKIQQL